MKIKLKFCSIPKNIIDGIRTCWDTNDKSDTIDPWIIGPNDRDLIKRIIRAGHTSTLEHSLVTYKFVGISRSVLQEISRHRLGVSPSVESTRYTFKKMLKKGDIEDHLISSDDPDLDRLNIEHMKKVRDLILEKNIPNDISKYAIVEAYKLTEYISFNIRSLRHFVMLRNSPKALKEIREISNEMINILPKEMYIFFEDLLNKG